MLAACFAFVLLVWPVGAQEVPSQPADAPPSTVGSRVIMDAVFWASPGDADETCMQLPPSQIAITLRLENVGTPQPVRYRFAPYWYRAGDSPSEIDTSVTVDPRTVEATLAGGRYCYAIMNEGAAGLDDDVSDSDGQAQLVAVRMTLAPQ
jgi:hypothetical protein